jgi:hypothetical protein
MDPSGNSSCRSLVSVIFCSYLNPRPPLYLYYTNSARAMLYQAELRAHINKKRVVKVKKKRR